MSLASRFFGKRDPDEPAGRQLVANPDIKRPLSLQVLSPDPDAVRLDVERLVGEFRSYHSSMSGVRCEIDAELGQPANFPGNFFGMIGWEKHVIRLVGFDAPMPAAAVERCIAPAHYPRPLKERARAHKAHVILYYAGYVTSPFEQYVALAATAGVLARLGAIVAVNEAGHTSLPAGVLSGSDSEGDILDLLRTFPLPILYCGFVKMEVEGVPGVWMRTYGAPLLELPDLAAHAKGHDEAQRYFDTFENIFSYLRESGSRLGKGHTAQIDDEQYLRFRAPSQDERFLESTGELLVVEIVSAGEINR
jgi:hypothetical protein